MKGQTHLTSIRLDADIREILKLHNYNTTGLINDLLREWLNRERKRITKSIEVKNEIEELKRSISIKEASLRVREREYVELVEKEQKERIHAEAVAAGRYRPYDAHVR